MGLHQGYVGYGSPPYMCIFKKWSGFKTMTTSTIPKVLPTTPSKEHDLCKILMLLIEQILPMVHDMTPIEAL